MTRYQPLRRLQSVLLSLPILLTAPAVVEAQIVDKRSIVLSYLADSFQVSFAVTIPSIPGSFSPNDGIAEELTRLGGAFRVGMERAGTPEDQAIADALFGRGLLNSVDRGDEAREFLETALSALQSRGWDDRRASSILRDLATLALLDGDPVASAAYLRRADICPIPCEDDGLFRFYYDTVSAAKREVYAAFGESSGAFRIARALGEDKLAFAETSFGPDSGEAIKAQLELASVLERDRPWDALATFQRALELARAKSGPGDRHFGIRWSIANLLLLAGDYHRLAGFSAEIVEDALADKASATAAAAARLRARALWHLRDPDARGAYGDAVDLILPEDSDFADFDDGHRELLRDLLDAGYGAEAVRIADKILATHPEDSDALYAKARVAAWSGDFDEAANLIARLAERSEVAALQRAVYLDKAGRAIEATALRVQAPLIASGEPPARSIAGDLFRRINPRDVGAAEGAAQAVRAFIDRTGITEQMLHRGSYRDAQHLWQVAYTLVRGGEYEGSFRLMKEAASIAARLSFADANDTDGGSLQLLRRDKFRYLLFVDIAWAATSGLPPDSMTGSSRP